MQGGARSQRPSSTTSMAANPAKSREWSCERAPAYSLIARVRGWGNFWGKNMLHPALLARVRYDKDTQNTA